MAKMIDMTNQQIGNWKVLYLDKDRHDGYKTYWICQCKCGKIKSICGTDLRRGKTSSCASCSKIKKDSKRQKKTEEIKNKPNGGYGPEYYENEIEKQFGKLTIISLSPEEVQAPHQPKKMRCRCECGNIIDIRIDNLHSGKSQSCGCVKSRGEQRIHQVLSECNINFIQEYSFDDLLGENGGKLRFDFAIFDSNNKLIKLIEFQGKQHYDYCPSSWNDIRPHDQLKRDYCIKNNIELLEIPYYDINKIDINYLLH